VHDASIYVTTVLFIDCLDLVTWDRGLVVDRLEKQLLFIVDKLFDF